MVNGGRLTVVLQRLTVPTADARSDVQVAATLEQVLEQVLAAFRRSSASMSW